MDIKEMVVNQIITGMSNILDQDHIEKLYGVLTITLHEYDITAQNYEVAEYDDYDRFLCEQYYAALKVEGKSPKTIDRYMEQLRLMMDWIQKPLKEINSEDIRYYLALYQQRRKIASSTLDGMRRCICAFFSWAEFAGYIDKSPARRIKQIKFQIKKEPALTSGQIEKAMINCNSIRDKAIISFMYETGARVSEVAGVKLSDIDFNERTVLIHGKGGKDRISLFTDKSAMYLEEYLMHRDLTMSALFESKQKGHALSAAGIRSMVYEVGKRAGIERLHPHRFRVSRITHLVDRGMPLQDVQELAGHTSINTTRGYYRNTLDNVKHSYLKAAQ
ncbi:MAG: tyrosine-type recombinase/integrase [Lachnospiraceae bacterium]